MPGDPMAAKRSRIFRASAVFLWVLIPVISLVLLASAGLRYASAVEAVSYTGGREGKAVSAMIVRPASSASVSTPHPAVLVVLDSNGPPPGLLPLLEDFGRSGTAGMTCTVSGSADATDITAAVKAFVGFYDIKPDSLWIVATGSAVTAALDYAVGHAVSGIVLLDPWIPADLSVVALPRVPVSILSAMQGRSEMAPRLISLYESLSGEDATLIDSAPAASHIAAKTYFSPNGDTQLFLYSKIPAGLGLLVPSYRNDILSWTIGAAHTSRTSAEMLLPIDAAVLFSVGSLLAFLLFGSAVIQMPSEKPPGKGHLLARRLFAFGVLLICVAVGLIGSFVMSRPLFRWEAAVAGVVILAARLAIYGFSSLARGWSRAADRFISYGLDVVDLAVYLILAAVVALYSGGSAFACVVAAIGAIGAWGYSRAVWGLSGSILMGHFAGALILASIL